MIDFSGKKGVILGAANQRSIATHIVRQLGNLGAEMALTYGPDPKGRFEQFARNLGAEFKSTQILPLNAQSDDDIKAVFQTLDKAWGGLDFAVHSVAFADRKNLEMPFSHTSREGWEVAMDVSAYSIIPVAQAAAELMKKNGGGSMVAMTFIGSVLAVPNYNVMGPAKAALEAIRGL